MIKAQLYCILHCQQKIVLNQIYHPVIVIIADRIILPFCGTLTKSMSLSSHSQHTGYLFTAVKRNAKADTPIAAAAKAVGVDNEVFDGALFDVEAVVVKHDVLEVPFVERAVDLRARAMHCRSLSAVQDLNRLPRLK